MAINQTYSSQLACKVIDLRKVRKPEIALRATAVNVFAQQEKTHGLVAKPKESDRLDERLKVYYREADILNSVKHPNIVGLEKVFISDHTMYIFQELVPGGDLYSYLTCKNGLLTEVEAVVILRQVVVAVKYLHSQNIVHRDLKPDNIMLTGQSTGCRVVLTDFGTARRLGSPLERMSSQVGTNEYVAPYVDTRLRDLKIIR
jgi:serine/threonine protein kinase